MKYLLFPNLGPVKTVCTELILITDDGNIIPSAQQSPRGISRSPRGSQRGSQRSTPVGTPTHVSLSRQGTPSHRGTPNHQGTPYRTPNQQGTPFGTPNPQRTPYGTPRGTPSSQNTPLSSRIGGGGTVRGHITPVSGVKPRNLYQARVIEFFFHFRKQLNKLF